MTTERGLKLLTQMDGDEVDGQLALACLQSSNLFEQAVSFLVFLSRFRDDIVPQTPEDIDIPILLLEYLLNCIEADITPEDEELFDGYVYDKGGAFLDLRVPLDPYWAKHDCELTEERYFERIAEFLKKHSNKYYHELPTHVLEAWSPRQKPFSTIMKGWKNDPILKRYVSDLESIFQLTI